MEEKEEEALFKGGVGDEVGVLRGLLVADDELKALLSLERGVHVSQAGPLS